MRWLSIVFIACVLAIPVHPEDTREQATLYKSPDCTCCEGHARYLKRNGIPVTIIETADLSALKKAHGVPVELEGCHTILYGGYVIEGHVSINTIRKLLRERPSIKGISLPGMPLGTPGMNGPKEGPLTVFEIKDGEKSVFAID